jgi:hypothetical protein
MVLGGQAPFQRSCATGTMMREQRGMTLVSRGASRASLPVLGRLALVLPIIN